jgi:UDP-glucose 4-epimerase
VNEIVEIIKEIFGEDIKVIQDKPRRGDIKHSYGDSLKAEKMLGFKAKVTLREGLGSWASIFCAKLLHS